MGNKDLTVKLSAKSDSGTNATFTRIEKHLKNLGKVAQNTAVQLSQLGMKEASATMSKLTQEVNGVTKAFAKGEKGVSQYANSLGKGEKSASLYDKALEKTGVSIGNHTKAVKELGKVYGTADGQTKNWVTALGKVETAGVALAQQFKGQRVALQGAKPYVAGYARSLNTSAIAQQVLSENIKITNGKFKILNNEGLSAFGNLTEKSARSLGMLDKSFGQVQASVGDVAAWKEAKRNYKGNAKTIDILTEKIKRNNITTQKATKFLETHGKRLKKTETNATRLGKGLDYLGNKFKSFSAYTLAAATTAATLGVAFKLLSTNIQYSQALKDLEAITGATTREMELLDKTIRRVAGTTKFSAVEIAEGMKMLGQSGFSASESIAAMESIANLATGTLSSMSTSVEIVTTALRVFHKDASETAEVTDIFTNAVNNSKLTIDKIKTALNYLGPIAESAGMSLKETTTSLMVLANSGIRASSMATGLRRVLKELISPSDKMVKAFKEAGYEVDDFNLKTNSMRDVVGKLKNVVTDTGVAFDLFGLRGATTATALVTQGLPAFDKMAAAVEKQGTAAKNAAIQLEGLGIKYKQIKDKAANLALGIGDSGLTSVLSAFADVVRNVLDGLTLLVANPVTSWVLKLTGAVASFVALEIAISVIAAAKAFTKLKVALRSAALAAKEFNRQNLKNTYLLVAAAVIALVLAYKKWHKTTTELIAAQNKLYSEAKKNVDTLSDEITKVSDFNGTASEKLSLVDKLAKAYPKYAAEIYNAGGKASDLLVVLTKIRDIQKKNQFAAAKNSLKLYATQIGKTKDALVLLDEELDSYYTAQKEKDQLPEKNAALRKYHETVLAFANTISNLQADGNIVSVEDFFPVDDFGKVSAATQGYIDDVKKILKARKDLASGGDEGKTKTFENGIAEYKRKLKELAVSKEKAIVSAESAKKEAFWANRLVEIKKEMGVSEADLLVTQLASIDAEKKSVAANGEVDRIGKAILANQQGLLTLKAKESALDLKMAQFSGDTKAISIAKENKAYQDQLVLVDKLFEDRKESGITEDVNEEKRLSQRIFAKKRHDEKILQIENEYSLKYIDLDKRTENAKRELTLKSEKDVKSGQIRVLAAKKNKNVKELEEQRRQLDYLLANESGNIEKIAALDDDIAAKKEEIYKAELKVIKKRNDAIQEGYNLEITKIDDVEKRSLQALENSNSRGLLSVERYERAKSDITNRAMVKRYTAATLRVTELANMENASEASTVEAANALQSVKDYFYQQEVAHANIIRAEHKKTSDAQIAQASALDEKRKKAAADRNGMLDSFGSHFAKIYGGVADVLSGISEKALSSATKSNMYLQNTLNASENVTNEITKWTSKMEYAQKVSDGYANSVTMAWGQWGTIYKDLADKWKIAAEASKEKLRYVSDIQKLENTEITDLSNVEGIQRSLNELKKNYNYLGEEDLKNLFAAKKALQDQLNQQRLLNAEKDTAKLTSISSNLEQARAAGVDISEYGFDQVSLDRMQQLEKESAILEDQIKQQEYMDALSIANMEQRGATEEELSTAREESEARIAEMRNPENLRQLEIDALSSKLNIEQMNLQVINDLKIKQFEDELARETELHNAKLENIKIENEARLKTIYVEEQATIDSKASFNDAQAPAGLKSAGSFATGGRIPGESTIDSVPVLARPGEWFIRNESAAHWSKKYGAGFMNGINKPLSAAGRGISSALSKVGNMSFPEVVQAPSIAFAHGGQVRSINNDDSSIAAQLSRLASAMENQNRSSNSNSKEVPGKTITVQLKSKTTQATGQFDENGAQALFKILKEQQMVVG